MRLRKRFLKRGHYMGEIVMGGRNMLPVGFVYSNTVGANVAGHGLIGKSDILAPTSTHYWGSADEGRAGDVGCRGRSGVLLGGGCVSAGGGLGVPAGAK